MLLPYTKFQESTRIADSCLGRLNPTESKTTNRTILFNFLVDIDKLDKQTNVTIYFHSFFVRSCINITCIILAKHMEQKNTGCSIFYYFNFSIYWVFKRSHTIENHLSSILFLFQTHFQKQGKFYHDITHSQITWVYIFDTALKRETKYCY